MRSSNSIRSSASVSCALSPAIAADCSFGFIGIPHSVGPCCGRCGDAWRGWSPAKHLTFFLRVLRGLANSPRCRMINAPVGMNSECQGANHA